MKLFKRLLVLIVLFICYTFVCAFSYANTISEDLSNSVFRLHILANSDSEEDQSLKLLVRDDFYEVARQTIVSEGYNYDVKLEIGKFDFPTKVYGDIALPAGVYDALRIEIGEAKRT